MYGMRGSVLYHADIRPSEAQETFGAVGCGKGKAACPFVIHPIGCLCHQNRYDRKNNDRRGTGIYRVGVGLCGFHSQQSPVCLSGSYAKREDGRGSDRGKAVHAAEPEAASDS